MSRILKWKLPVDDQWHPVPNPFQHCAVDYHDPGVVWIYGVDQEEMDPWEMRVFGTGHEIPDGTSWISTVRHDPTGLVWHVLVRQVEPTPEPEPDSGNEIES